MRYTFLSIFFAALLISCQMQSPTEIYQNSRNNIVDVRNKIIAVELENPEVSPYTYFQIVDKYLVFADWKGYDKLIHLFDKNNFQHITSFGTLGQGPNDITHIGSIVPDEKRGKFYVFDQGKRKLLSFDVDSLVSESNYKFTIKTNLLYDCPVDFVCINDTFSIALYADYNEDTGGGDLITGAWNMITKEFVQGYENPLVRKKRYQFAASEENGIYVTTSSRYDLMTICNLDGSLKYNIYGPNWNKKITKICHYNSAVCIGDKNIYALYSGGDNRTDSSPSKIIVFDLEGNYIKTLETGLKNLEMCYDKEKHRLFFFTNSEMQFGYLDLEGII